MRKATAPAPRLHHECDKVEIRTSCEQDLLRLGHQEIEMMLKAQAYT